MEILAVVGVVAIIAVVIAIIYEHKRIASVASSSELKVANWAHVKIATAEDNLKDHIRALEQRVNDLEKKYIPSH